ncbi:VCBS repeat-containing protein [Deminuibacter soli]|uniref:RNA-binding protein n=1 Tax=Deminuibacter soli TaxID=2291815 RepID=A0A3E1NKM8_9BACT|nr:VCBS repeat-containing protein [Deminuibacter soli]RFM28490.1 RNA-binding protein [Deminuibacter soli]
MILRNLLPLACIVVLPALPAAAQTGKTLFQLRPSSQTGISFKNQLTESDTINILNQANIYNGGGVGTGDFNNDGLPDLYFAGNMVSNKLYLNKGGMDFTDVTDAAGVGGNGHWCTGVSVVDINNDGLQDIYVCASFRKDARLRTNLLYINQGVGKDGIPTFKESAAAYGLDDTGFSTQAYFFDYDKDGDLDLYLVTNELYDPKTPIKFRPKVKDGSAKNTDRLFRNNGNGTFTNVSKQAGIQTEGWGHAACITDINRDGWPDVYVANDFVSNDLCYINNHDGTFTDRLGEYFRHTAWNAMGTDAVDINNDGLIDFLSLEMLPEDNLRKKRMLSGNEYYNYTNSARYGYTHQYVRNVLQLNRGLTAAGKPVFSDIGYMAGVYQTDWSWCPLIADFDNDGLRDIIISNGLPRDVTDLDYIDFNNGQQRAAGNYTLAMTDSLPVVKLPNYSFKNTTGTSFQNTSQSWGFTHPSFSNGAVYADLDNDGDLDVVINNINDEAFVYENTLDGTNTHSLTITIAGPAQNTNGYGAQLTVHYGDKMLYYQHQPARGYLSTDDARAHFGLGTATQADSIVVQWPDGKTQLWTNVPAGKPFTIAYKDAISKTQAAPAAKPVFTNVASKYGIRFKPKERDFVDYDIQPTIPHKLSQYGPGIAVGDIDNNGLEDFYLGGTSGNSGVFFMQQQGGKFTIDSARFAVKDDPLYEDMGVLFFDADNDGDLDLYLVSGSYEIPPNHPISNDRLFINNGKGRFSKSETALPADSTNGSCVRAADFDGDGDLDLFVGGRVVSGSYPTAPRSFLYKNNHGKFTDVTAQYCPELANIGMVTDALWTDFDNDGKIDLIVTGEWMPVSFFKNTGTALVNVTANTGIATATGWWNSLAAGDFDNDGDMDYVAGNLGLNSNYQATAQEPLTLLAKDMDNNGSMDAMVFCYMKAADGTRKSFPMSTRDDMVAQVISIRKRYPTYKSFGMATMTDIWRAKERDGAISLQATNMASCYIENKGNGRFAITPLPAAAQTAPVFGMLAQDVDNDGNLDLLLTGNDYGMEPYSGRHDAFAGLYLHGDGKGNFSDVPLSKSGFCITGDGKALANIFNAQNEQLVIATQNQDSLLLFHQAGSAPAKRIQLKPGDCSAVITLANGTTRKMEFYYGSGFLSQSSRSIPVNSNITQVIITNYMGTKRKVL